MLAKMTNNLVGQPMFRLKKRIRELELEGEEILHFEIGDSPFTPSDTIIKATVDSLLKGETHYTASSGIIELKEAIAKATYKEYDFLPNINQILIMPANAIIDFVVRCVCDKEDEVIIPDPRFPSYASVLAYNGIKESKGITSKTKLWIINSPCNPTGEVLNKKDITNAYDLAVEHNWFLLSDEVYSKMVYGTDHFSPSRFDKCEDRVILLKSFSKIYAMAGFRLGYAIGPEQLIEKMSLLFQTIFSCMPVFIQRAGIQALEEDVQDKIDYYKECRDLIVAGLNEIQGITCKIPKGAFYVFPDIKETGLTDEKFAELMLEVAGVALLPGSNFGKNGEGHVRLCYATTKSVIKKALEKIHLIGERYWYD